MIAVLCFGVLQWSYGMHAVVAMLAACEVYLTAYAAIPHTS